MFKKSLALLLSVLMAFSFAMVASAEAIDYAYAPAAVEAYAEADIVPLDDDNDNDEWDRMLWIIYVPALTVREGGTIWCWVVAILAWPLNFIGINLGNLSAWLTDVGAVDVLATVTSFVAGIVLAAAIAIPVINIIRGIFGGD
ncbi:MAG: hypothetical protein FWB76_05860 [Oscillospiraceae bacterium]|nr:hypothetical protein [Oscillospiraceae bacterium]